MDIRAQQSPRSSQPHGRQHVHRGTARTISLLTILALTLATPLVLQAKTFQCRGGNVTCLIAAITQANVQPGKSHEIRLAAGTYTLTAVHNEIDGPNGLPSITRALTVVGAGADATIIQRDASAPSFRIWHVSSAGHLELKGLTVQGGDAASAFTGGGLLTFGRLVLTASAVRDNTAVEGAGLYNAGGTVTIRQSTFTDNLGAGPSFGGGLATIDGSVSITESTFLENKVFLLGGGIYTRRGTVSIARSVFVRNTADGGGGLYNEGGTVALTHTTLANNGAGTGGGLLNSGTLTITDSTIVGNRVANFQGGGLANGTGTVTLTNTTVAGNRTPDYGGGLSTFEGLLRLINCTVADNEATLGGGGLVNSNGTVELHNTILARNSTMNPPVGQGPDCLGELTSLGHNLIGDLTDCIVTPQDGDLTGEPGLGTFIDGGAPGEGHLPLLDTSRAINVGDDAACPPTDQLGQPRVEICDIGAIEFQP